MTLQTKFYIAFIALMVINAAMILLLHIKSKRKSNSKFERTCDEFPIPKMKLDPKKYGEKRSKLIDNK